MTDVGAPADADAAARVHDAGPLAENGSCTSVPAVQHALVERFGEREALVHGDTRLTFREWHHETATLAGNMASVGVRRGDVVAVMLPPSVDYAVAVSAAQWLGAVASGINQRLGDGEVGGVLATGRPRLLIGPPDVARFAGDGVLFRTMEELRAADAQPVPPPGDLRLDDAAAIVWTSGTTGTPKGAWYDYRGLKAVSDLTDRSEHAKARMLVAVPFSHAGYMTKLWAQQSLGYTIVIANTPWSAADMLTTIERERITIAAGVPTQWEKVLVAPELDPVDTSSLQLVTIGTSPASAELVRALRVRFRCDVSVRYASTESPMGTRTWPADEPSEIEGTVGRPFPGVELRLVDDAGRPVERGRTGLVQLRSHAIMRGYWDRDDLTSTVVTDDGFVQLGDFAFEDTNGNLVLQGRRGDMYIRGGYNVYPLEIEDVIARHPGVAAVAVVGVPAPVIGEIGVAYVEPTDPSTPPDPEELRRLCRQLLADYKSPDRIVFVDALPRTAVMKIDKKALRDKKPPV